MAWIWIDKSIVLAIHDEQIAEHGGEAGLRDEGLLISALARPLNKANYADINVINLAAAYGYRIARNQPFLDGNKRTALVTMELFLILNDWELKADDGLCLEIFIALADGSLSEKDLTSWLKANTLARTP
jgi:death on curing protein